MRRNYSFLIDALSLPKTRKGNPQIIAMRVCKGGVKVGVVVGLVGEEVPDLSGLSTPTESETKDISSLKFEAMGPARCWLLLGQRSAETGWTNRLHRLSSAPTTQSDRDVRVELGGARLFSGRGVL